MYKKKLIEVALPLEAINREAIRENYIYRGNPSAIHKWWAQRPFAVARCVLFASLVTDPSSRPDKWSTEEEQDAERARLFLLIERLARWESIDDDAVIAEACEAIEDSTDGRPPSVVDPFSGGATIPLESQRLGLDTYASDLNPVAALIARALLEYPRQFRDRPPVHPAVDAPTLPSTTTWPDTTGLAEDVRYYGERLRKAAHERLRHLYPSASLPDGTVAPVIAWLWARTVRCPNPACGAETPLARSFAVSTKKGSETWADPVVDKATRAFRFEVRDGKVEIEGTVGRRGAVCIVCEEPMALSHIRAEGVAGRLGTRLLATVVNGDHGRAYVSPDEVQECAAAAAERPGGLLDTDLPEQALGFRVQGYGMRQHRDLYTNRQLLLLGTMSELVKETRLGVELDSGGDAAYAAAITTYLAFVLDKVAQFNSSLVPWYAKENRQHHTFGRQTLSMTWDFAEGNPFAGVGGGIDIAVSTVAGSLGGAAPNGAHATVLNQDAREISIETDAPLLISTDPPYYDNVPYADLSDYFYVWLRRSISDLHPDFFRTLLVPKAQELIAEPSRFAGNRQQARAFFESGMRDVFKRLRALMSEEYPLTVYYAFKQAETTETGASASTGWETMLSGLIDSGFAITGTWPTRTERTGRMRDTGSNALASSIVLVCRRRQASAPLATRKEFLSALRQELPAALYALQKGNIAPVDLAQAAIGPGMAVFSRYSKVMEADGSQMPVRAALTLINQTLDEILAEQEGEFDADTRWAIAWFEQLGTDKGDYGTADVLARAKNTSVAGMVEAGIVESNGGKVRLLRRHELDEEWDPTTDKRLTVWEMTQHLLRRLDEGEAAAASLARQLGSYSEVARDLAYRLYVICDRKKWSQEGQAYNGLVVAWPQIQQLAARVASSAETTQEELF